MPIISGNSAESKINGIFLPRLVGSPLTPEYSEYGVLLDMLKADQGDVAVSDRYGLNDLRDGDTYLGTHAWTHSIHR